MKTLTKDEDKVGCLGFPGRKHKVVEWSCLGTLNHRGGIDSPVYSHICWRCTECSYQVCDFTNATLATWYGC